MLFSKAIVLVEGPAELYRVPAMADAMGFDLDALGITVCSVHGADFAPYKKAVGAERPSDPEYCDHGW